MPSIKLYIGGSTMGNTSRLDKYVYIFKHNDKTYRTIAESEDKARSNLRFLNGNVKKRHSFTTNMPLIAYDKYSDGETRQSKRILKLERDIYRELDLVMAQEHESEMLKGTLR